MVRRADARDVTRLTELLDQVCMVHHRLRPDLFSAHVPKYSPEELNRILSDPDRPVFVYEDGDGSVLGHAFCEIIRRSPNRVLKDVLTLYIDDICVDEAARGGGVGRALFEAVREFAEDLGCHNVTLNVWSGNDAALAFYEKMGFVPQKTGMEIVLDKQ